MSRKYSGFLYTPCSPLTPRQLPPPSSSTRGVHLLQSMNLHRHILVTRSPQFRVHPWWCTFYGFWQRYNDKHPTYIYGRCMSLKILYGLPIQHFLPPTPGNHRCFMVSIVLTVPECHIVGIIQHVTSSYWLLLLSSTPTPLCCRLLMT